MKNCPALRINSQEKVETKEHVLLSPSEWEGPVCFLPPPPSPPPSPLPSSPSLTRLLGTKISEGIQWYSMVQFWDTLEQTLCREPVVPLSSGSEGRGRGGEGGGGGRNHGCYVQFSSHMPPSQATTWYVSTCAGDGSGNYQGFHKAFSSRSCILGIFAAPMYVWMW